jgi:hypothetical protein
MKKYAYPEYTGLKEQETQCRTLAGCGKTAMKGEGVTVDSERSPVGPLPFHYFSHKSVIGWLDSVDKSHCASVNIRREAR